MWISEDASCTAVAKFYRRRFGWPATAAGHAVWTLAGETMDAVDVPHELAWGTRAALRRNGRPHAIIDVPGVPSILGYWRFPVQPRRQTPFGWVRQLAELGVAHHSHATLIELPPTAVAGGRLRWLTPPTSEFPPLSCLLAAVLRASLTASERSRSEHGTSPR